MCLTNKRKGKIKKLNQNLIQLTVKTKIKINNKFIFTELKKIIAIW